MNTLGVQQFRDIRFESLETFRVPTIRCATRARDDYGVTPLAVCVSNWLGSLRRPGRAMTTFNRIFTTERLLQIILILAATVAMKLLA
jgi:hypothetical protein